ncbi:FUSC family protein [Synechococcus sp. A10-1-5-1]|uniref:FUSC family protein n=1 Tax=Synechococcus sp. A10-1-5-1 TaxID=2936507 RepID=UPI0020012DB0|nr:FUSC family protein [Synechococcus sp. A10-1-5-1]UPM50950.1 FUSC family protein [Synechococcus sp. A10-1-5-1]
MDALLVRNTLKMFTAVFITAAIALWFERIEFVWYPLMAVVIVVDDNDDHTVKAATARVMGTVVGGLVTFVVHTILSGWVGVMASILLLIPVLRLFGWQSGLSTAATLSVMFLMIPRYEALDWDYVFNRGLDTVVGCLVALGVGLLFWPRNSYRELQRLDHRLLADLQSQLERYQGWLNGEQGRPRPLNTAPLTSDLMKMTDLVERERRGPRQKRLHSSRWQQRLRLWQLVQFHWIAWERLIEGLPTLEIGRATPLQECIRGLNQQLQGAGQATPTRAPQLWQELAQTQQLPLLQLLALEEETRPLHASLGTLARQPC